MTELDKRIRAILVKLQLLSEAKAGAVARTSHDANPDRVGPPGTQTDRSSDRPPPKDRSLFEFYQWAFAHAKDDDRRRLLCYLAERDYERFRHRSPNRRRGTENQDGPETDADWGKRVIEWYVGMDVVEVAILEECSVGTVEKARRMGRRNEKDGRERGDWAGWDEAKKRSEVLRCRGRGMSQATTAAKLGTSKRTVQRFWHEPDQVEDAA